MVRILGIGDNTVDIYVDQGVQFPGGNAVNVAVLMKRLGADAAYLGCVGDDFLGDLVRDALVAEGIDISRLRRASGGNSWSRIRHVGNDRVFDGNYPSFRDDYRLSEADFAWMAGFDLAHSSVYSKLEAALPAIRAAGPALSFDYSSEWTDAYIARTAPHLDIAFLSAADPDDDACAALARQVAAHGPALVIVTRGAKGALALEGGAVRVQPIEPAEVVDTLGAGDGFIAGLLMARFMGADLSQQLAAGARNAARVCEERGAFGYETPIRHGQPGLVRRPDEAGQANDRYDN
ncbi:MAG: fructoselysine kinase [Albidovulum sp.]|uniref:PfkB family carbohydrate kinase n=1 Tax=Albidovulum sp. TaxID=1872424 RepID=UPI00132978C4|nr:PfkB family carbohydrate kinase [Defluviimonas sp.]KAB2884227.1 MAG: fructoselysine kinase [Defluviimonas sp.]